jgi:tetratricopeptide (TPR) repeat protein
MKKLLIVLLLLTAAFAMAQSGGKKVIQNSKEFDAYMAAINITDNAAKAKALEAFLATYPNTIVKEESLQALLLAYQQTSDVNNFFATGDKLLAVNPNNLTGLFYVSYIDRILAAPKLEANPSDADANKQLASGGELAARGITVLETVPKEDGFTDEQWAQRKTAMKNNFILIIGHAAYQAKDYARAQEYLKQAVAANPTDLASVYLLARSYSDPKPPVLDGLFWLARASVLAPAGSVKDNLTGYAKRKYVRFHGGEDGFDAVLAAAANPAMPADFAVKPAPTPAEQAADMMAKTPTDKLDFASWEFILTAGDAKLSDQLWTAIKGKASHIQGWVIEVTPTVVKIAGTDDAREKKIADIELTLATPLTPRQFPAADKLITFIGTNDSYTVDPKDSSFLLKQTDGAIDGLPSAAEPKHAPAHHHR